MALQDRRRAPWPPRTVGWIFNDTDVPHDILDEESAPSSGWKTVEGPWIALEGGDPTLPPAAVRAAKRYF